MVMTGRSYFLQEKAEAFAGRIIKMYQYLTSLKHEHVMSKQVLRSGTSIGANIAESKDAQSSSDYINKLNIALKEADETSYWIKNLYIGGYINEKEYMSIQQDAEELGKLLVSAIKKVKSRLGRL
jgi:four helix bundle protein